MIYGRDSSVASKGLALLRDLIHEQTGILFDDESLDSLFDKVESLAADRGFDSILDYYYLLRYDVSAAEEWRRVFDVLSVRETYFWRESGQIRTLVDNLLPQALSRGNEGRVRIWSAACATGEEPLTIAMALNEAGLLESGRIEIYATDGSPQSITGARAGLYRERAFRAMPPGMRDKYFTQEPGGWRALPSLRRHVQWGVANLMSCTDVAPFAGSRFIFCRNVFIYFSTRSVRKVVDLLSERMPRPGYLFLGAAESLVKVTSTFQLQEIGGAFVYVKD
jgi:chemotaxis protein methyltransferase CheR